jgi:hypothetical protein
MEEKPPSDEGTLYAAWVGRGGRNRESEDAVAELAAELRRAYMVKGLQAQLEERQARSYAEHVRERASAESARCQERQETLEEDRRRRAEILQRCEEYRRQLDVQLKRKEEERRVLAEEAREYRRFLEEADRTREEEERSRALQRKCELTKRTRRERLILEEMREIGRQMEREIDERERQRDLDYLRETEERSKEMSRLKQEQAERRERVLMETARMILDAEIRKREREERLIDLVAEEIRCEIAIREIEEAMRRKKMQQELAIALREQMVFTEQSKQRYVDEDRAWADEIMRKIMEDEKLARFTAEARRRLKLQYRQDLENLMAHRRRIREEEIARIEEIAKEEQKLRIAEAECAKEERRRLLTKHAANVASFVNPATLTPEEQEFLAELSKKAEDAGDTVDDIEVPTEMKDQTE